jgi:hypothetical protein
MAICPVRLRWTSDENPEFQVALRNVRNEDVFLNLGMTLGNGSRHYPDAVSLLLTDAEGHSRELHLTGPPGVAGRVDDYAVGFQSGSVHILKLRLSQFSSLRTHEYKMKLPKGHYKMMARFEGRGALHKSSGMDWAAWNFWEGTLQSNIVEFDVQESKSDSKSDSEPFSDLRPAGDGHFSADEQRIVAAARAYLESHVNRGKPLDARYRVKRTRDGYEVFAMFVAGYENGRPLYYPGGHGFLVLRADGRVTRYMPGE